MTKARTKPTPKAEPKTDAEYLCIVDRVNFDDGRVLMLDQTITLTAEEAVNPLKAEQVKRV